MEHFDIQVYGRVQGVSFRYYAQKTARAYHIKGYVKNMPDGSVYIEAEGDTENLKKFIEWCHHGPGWAHVENVHTEKGALRNFNDFNIRH